MSEPESAALFSAKCVIDDMHPFLVKRRKRDQEILERDAKVNKMLADYGLSENDLVEWIKDRRSDITDGM